MAYVVENIMKSAEFIEKVISCGVNSWQFPKITGYKQIYVGEGCCCSHHRILTRSEGQRSDKLLRSGHLKSLCGKLYCV